MVVGEDPFVVICPAKERILRAIMVRLDWDSVLLGILGVDDIL